MPGTGPVEASTDSLRAAPLEGIDRSLLGGECWVVTELSHPAFCSARNLTACAATLGGHALDVVEGLIVRLRVFVLPSIQKSLHRWFGERLPANATVPLVKPASRPSQNFDGRTGGRHVEGRRLLAVGSMSL